MPIARKNINPDFLNQIKENTTKEEPVIEEVPEVKEPVAVQAAAPKKAPEPKPDAPKVETVVKTEPVQVKEAEPVKPAAVQEKTDKYADVMNIRLSKGRRNEIKAFCSKNGISITQYIETSFAFLANEVASGNIVISKAGISKVAQ